AAQAQPISGNPTAAPDPPSGPPTGIVAIHPTTGEQSIISRDGYFVLPTYIAKGPHDDIYVSDLNAGQDGLGAVIKVDLATGKQTMVAQGGLFNHPNAVYYFHQSGLLVVVNVGESTGEVRDLVGIEIPTGIQRHLSQPPDGFGFQIGVGLAVLPRGAT